MRTALLLVLLLPPLVPAQVSEAQAVKEAKASAKAALATFKTAVNAARDAFLDDVASVDAAFKAGKGSGLDLSGLFDSAVALQTAVQDAVLDADLDIAGGMQIALNDFADGADLDGVLPLEFQVGRSGILDDANVAIDKLLAKTYASLQKRLDKTEALVEKSSVHRMTFSISRPWGSLHHAASELTNTGYPAGFGIDVILGMRDSTTPLTGAFFIAGTDGQATSGPGIDVELIHVDKPAEPAQILAATPDLGRWSALVASLKPGNYVCAAYSHADATSPRVTGNFCIP